MTCTSPTSKPSVTATHSPARKPTCLARGALFRLLVALIADELGRHRTKPIDAAEWSRWSEAQTVDEEGLGVDSLARLDLVARVNEFFHLHETGAEDYLVVHRQLGEWVDIIDASIARKFDQLTFRTSGSTGEPKRLAHEVIHLWEEIDAFAAILGAPKRIIACVPPHHLYGFLWTVLVAEYFGLEILDARLKGPSLLKRCDAGDLVVATPHGWDLFVRGLGDATISAGVTGIVSSAPMSRELWGELHEKGLTRLVEIFGSTETAGVGWREAPEAPFVLTSCWSRTDEETPRLRRLSSPDNVIDAPDRLIWESEQAFRPAGRCDQAVQIAGVNVFPERVRAVLEEADIVQEAAVRLTIGDAAARLKAFVVLATPLPDGLAIDQLQAHCAERLSAAERPIRFDFGAALPRNAMGKPADWL